MKNQILLFAAVLTTYTIHAQNIGIGTIQPDTTLHLVGKLKIVDGSESAGYLGVTDSFGVMSWTDPSTVSTIGDDLGNHTATQNLAIGPNWLTRNGETGKGISFVNDGNIGVLGLGSGNITLLLREEAVPESTFYHLAIVDNSNEIQSFFKLGTAYFSEKIGINTESPTRPLDVNGTIRIQDGGQIPDAILTSDSEGNVSWAGSTGMKMVYATTVITTEYSDTDSWQDVTTDVTMGNVRVNANIKLQAGMTLRLTEGSSTDLFYVRVKMVAGGNTKYSDTKIWLPDQSGNDHDNFKQVSYLDVDSQLGGDNITFTLQVRNSGDDAWEIRDRILVVTEY